MNLVLSQVRLPFPISDHSYPLSKALIKAQEICIVVSVYIPRATQAGVVLSCKDVGQAVCLAWGAHCARCTSHLILPMQCAGVKIAKVCGRAATASLRSHRQGDLGSHTFLSGSPGFVLCISSAVQSWLLVNSPGCSRMCSSSVTGWEF